MENVLVIGSEEHEIEYNKWKIDKKVEFEEIFISLKNYFEKNNLNLPKNFEDFFEFWIKDLPIGSYDSEINESDFFKFHFFIKGKMDKDNLLIKTNSKNPKSKRA